MYKQHQSRQWYCCFSSMAFHRAINWRKSHLRIIWAASAFLVLAAPTVIDLPGSRLLAENVISQDLDAAILYQQGVTRYNRKDLEGAESAFRQALEQDPNIGMARNYLEIFF